jgi:hypothetical protein
MDVVKEISNNIDGSESINIRVIVQIKQPAGIGIVIYL